MQLTLYVIPASHPSACAEAALALKGLPYRRVDLLPVVAKAVGRLSYGGTTVPALKVEGEAVVGSRPILRRLEELRPEPPLLPADAEARRAVERAEEWGDEVLQPLTRRLVWAAFRRAPGLMLDFAGDAKVALPKPLRRAAAPATARIASRLNRADDLTVQADLRSLPGHLDRVDAWIGEGVMGAEEPNAADLQVGASLRLLERLGDLRPLLAGRPCAALAARFFPPAAGDVPAGTLPEAWLPGPGRSEVSGQRR